MEKTGQMIDSPKRKLIGKKQRKPKL